MKLEIYDEKPAETEKVVRLKLIKTAGGVAVMAVEEDGTTAGHDGCGNLLLFLSNGRIELCEGVADDLGFDLDSGGSIMVNN